MRPSSPASRLYDAFTASGRWTTVDALARDIGISRNIVSNWLNGRSQPMPQRPSHRAAIARFAELAGVDAADIWGGDAPLGAADGDMDSRLATRAYAHATRLRPDAGHHDLLIEGISYLIDCAAHPDATADQRAEYARVAKLLLRSFAQNAQDI